MYNLTSAWMKYKTTLNTGKFILKTLCNCYVSNSLMLSKSLLDLEVCIWPYLTNQQYKIMNSKQCTRKLLGLKTLFVKVGQSDVK